MANIPEIPTIGNPNGIWGEPATIVGEVLDPATQAEFNSGTFATLATPSQSFVLGTMSFATISTAVIKTRAFGDSQPRFIQNADGGMEFGNGSTPQGDVTHPAIGGTPPSYMTNSFPFFMPVGTFVGAITPTGIAMGLSSQSHPNVIYMAGGNATAPPSGVPWDLQMDVSTRALCYGVYSAPVIQAIGNGTASVGVVGKPITVDDGSAHTILHCYGFWAPAASKTANITFNDAWGGYADLPTIGVTNFGWGVGMNGAGTAFDCFQASGSNNNTIGGCAAWGITWNSGATVCEAFRVSITDTASAASSLIANWRVGGATMWSVRKDGLVFSAGGLSLADGKGIAVGTVTGTQIGTVGGAAGQKLGFFGATAIVQPVLATGAAHTVDDVITALQNLGLVRQT